MCDKAVSNDPFMVKYCVDRYKTQEMCNKAVNDFLPALKFIPDWFVTSKLSKSLDDALFSNDDILFFDEDSNSVTSFGGEIGILSVDLIELILMMLIFMKMILKLLFRTHLWLGLIDLNKINYVNKI